eukprot:TRINITY_DN4505_c2_g1_i1.p2 TRINITY_DN4505_c2_g1~~TRINITY_DN4505_c2_g1_i1.p2  ORF type:complete len:145 (-),score=13.14 TRINITY_DN4505_c2_g1_i1:338-772(-)
MLTLQMSRVQVLKGVRKQICCRKRRYYVIRAHDDDDDVLPIFQLPKETTAYDIEKLPRNPEFQGVTIGEKLQTIHKQYQQQERGATAAMEEHLYSENWDWKVLKLLLFLNGSKNWYQKDLKKLNKILTAYWIGKKQRIILGWTK